MGKKALKCEERRNRDDLSQWMVSPLSVLGSSGKLRAHFGLFHSDKAGCPENPPPSLYTVHGSSSKLRRRLRTRQKHHTFLLILFSFGFAVPQCNSEHASALTSGSGAQSGY